MDCDYTRMHIHVQTWLSSHITFILLQLWTQPTSLVLLGNHLLLIYIWPKRHSFDLFNVHADYPYFLEKLLSTLLNDLVQMSDKEGWSAFWHPLDSPVVVHLKWCQCCQWQYRVTLVSLLHSSHLQCPTFPASFRQSITPYHLCLSFN